MSTVTRRSLARRGPPTAGPRPLARRTAAAVVGVAALALAGCTSGEAGVPGLRDDAAGAYVSGDSTVQLVAAEERGEPVEGLAGDTLAGEELDLADLRAASSSSTCGARGARPATRRRPPSSRAEAGLAGPDGPDRTSRFVGLNIRDRSVEAAAGFEEEYGIDWPSLHDPDSLLLLRLADEVPANAVPATLVLDEQGRVAARMLAQVDEATLVGVVEDVARQGPGGAERVEARRRAVSRRRVPGRADRARRVPAARACRWPLLAGLVSFASPCVLPLVPGYLAYVSGLAGPAPAAGGRRPRGPPQGAPTSGAATGGRRRPVPPPAAAPAATAVLADPATVPPGGWSSARRCSSPGSASCSSPSAWSPGPRGPCCPAPAPSTSSPGIVAVVMGLVFLGVLPFLRTERRPRWRPAVGLAGAPLLGAAFGVGWIPCVGPTLAAVLGLSPRRRRRRPRGPARRRRTASASACRSSSCRSATPAGCAPWGRCAGTACWSPASAGRCSSLVGVLLLSGAYQATRRGAPGPDQPVPGAAVSAPTRTRPGAARGARPPGPGRRSGPAGPPAGCGGS